MDPGTAFRIRKWAWPGASKRRGHCPLSAGESGCSCTGAGAGASRPPAGPRGVVALTRKPGDTDVCVRAL